MLFFRPFVSEIEDENVPKINVLFNMNPDIWKNKTALKKLSFTDQRWFSNWEDWVELVE